MNEGKAEEEEEAKTYVKNNALLLLKILIWSFVGKIVFVVWNFNNFFSVFFYFHFCDSQLFRHIYFIFLPLFVFLSTELSIFGKFKWNIFVTILLIQPHPIHSTLQLSSYSLHPMLPCYTLIQSHPILFHFVCHHFCHSNWSHMHIHIHILKKTRCLLVCLPVFLSFFFSIVHRAHK